MKHCLIFLFLIATSSCDNLSQEVGNPDDKGNIERPCQSYDVNCIRKYFANHAQCKPAYGPAPDPIIRSQNNLYIARSNMSLTIINQIIGGINGRVDEFYINRETDKLVIAIEFRNLSMQSDEVYFRFHRRAKEPIVTKAFATVTYLSVLITVVIPTIEDLQLENAEYVAFVNDALPPFVIGPTVAESSDPQVQLSLAQFILNVPTNIQELYLTDAAFYPANFIQYNICDFGLLVL